MNNKKGVEVSKNTHYSRIKAGVLNTIGFKLLFAIVTIGMIGFVSCQKEQIEQPGNIPGMGYTEGELEAQIYEFNENLSFGEIRGVSSSSLFSVLKSTGTFEFNVVGSGDQITVQITVKNDHETECRSLWFRAGTVFEVDDPNVQNAVLLCPVNVCVPPSSEKTFTLYMYCLNEGKERPTEGDVYKFKGVTTSKHLLELIELLKDRKINFEHYTAFPESDINYEDMIIRLQSIVWKITNGLGIDDEAKEFINSLPNLPVGVLPDGIYDIYVPLPYCWCFDECLGKTGALSYIAFDSQCVDVVTDISTYSTSGYNFDVETNYNYNNREGEIINTIGSIKFEAPEGEPQLGESGAVEIGYFTFVLPCYDVDFTITTKNKYDIVQTVDITNMPEGIVMTNGFMVEFVNVNQVDNGYEYTFRVISDSCN